MITRLAEASGVSNFRAGLRSAIRALWAGVWGEAEFIGAVGDSIETAYPQAWLEGAKACGIISLDELTVLEQNALRQATYDQFAYIPPFADAVVAGSRANGGKLAPLLRRADMWVNGYNGIVAKAKTMSCGDLKGAWRLGATEVHCSTCSALNGKVKRMSYWAAHVLPQNPPNPKLECGGWRCDCTIEPTDLPLSKGKLPGLR